jgi:hypothetical protein
MTGTPNRPFGLILEKLIIHLLPRVAITNHFFNKLVPFPFNLQIQNNFAVVLLFRAVVQSVQ